MNPDEEIPPPTETENKSHPFAWPIAAAVIGLFVLIAFLVVLRTVKKTYDETVDRSGKTAKAVAEKLEGIAEKFRTGTITTTFLAAIPEVSSTGMGNLELAIATQTETLRVEDDMKVMWDRLSLGKTESEIRVPVTYRYHLKLSDDWSLDVTNQTCIVRAPKIRPSLPPAVHTHQMEKKSTSGWGRFNAGEQLSELERSLTPTFALHAADPKHIALVREECRKTVGEFVKNWLLKEDHWRTDRFSTIKVIFADEQETNILTPTLELPR